MHTTVRIANQYITKYTLQTDYMYDCTLELHFHKTWCYLCKYHLMSNGALDPEFKNVGLLSTHNCNIPFASCIEQFCFYSGYSIRLTRKITIGDIVDEEGSL